MPRRRSTRRSASARAVVSHHREVLASTKAAVAKWAAADNTPRRVPVATSILALLADCADDTNGEATLDALDAIFEDHEGALPPSVQRQLAALTKAAHALGRTAEQQPLEKMFTFLDRWNGGESSMAVVGRLKAAGIEARRAGSAYVGHAAVVVRGSVHTIRRAERIIFD